MQVLGHYREHQQYITATGLSPSSEMETGYGVQIPGWRTSLLCLLRSRSDMPSLNPVRLVVNARASRI